LGASDGEVVAGESLRAVLVAAGALVAATLPAAAQDATWNLNGTGDYNTNGNWTPSTVPGGTAFFGVSNQNAVSFSAATTTIGGWTFNAGASTYTFSVGDQTLTFGGAGIVNGGSATLTNGGNIEFNNSSTAGSATITSNGTVQFNDSSSAGNASITNNNTVFFVNTSTAGSATITNNGGG